LLGDRTAHVEVAKSNWIHRRRSAGREGHGIVHLSLATVGFVALVAA
jgi:hypothetical protein